MSEDEKKLSLETQEGRVTHGPNGERQEAAMLTKVGIPMEAAILVAIDQIQTSEFQQRLMDALDDTHNHMVEMDEKAFERAEARKDRQSEEYIKRQNKGQWMSFVLVFCALGVFCWMFDRGASALQLCAIGVFLLGPAGVLAISNFIKANTPNKS